MARLWMGFALLMATAWAYAAVPAAYMRQAEASMLVTGRIRIDGEGAVTGFALDKEDQLPPEAVSLVRAAAPNWRFKPVLRDGQPVSAATDMTLRLVASKLGDGSYRVAIRSAHFAEKRKPGDNSTRMRPPIYPKRALDAGVSGTVYLLLKVGNDGQVMDAIPEQVNLATVTGARSMERWHGILAEASLARAREWRFDPSLSPEGTSAFSLVRVPVSFRLGPRADTYGRWQVYIPGPRMPNPWAEDQEETAFSPDVLPPGEAYRAGTGWRLMTALSGA